MFLHYAGNIISGSRGYAVTKDRNIEVWAMYSHSHPMPPFPPPANPDDPPPPKDIPSERKEEPIPEDAKFELKCVLVGHSEKVTCLSYSSDEFYLLSGSVDRSIKLWCIRTKTILCSFRGHTRTIWDVHFSPSGYYLLSGSADGLAILWKTD